MQSCLQAKDTFSGGFYLNKTHDPAKMQSLTASAAQCSATEHCGSFSPFPAACGHDRCFDTYSIGKSEQCLSLMGNTSDCALCLCMEDAKNSAACLFDTSCAPIFHCAVKAGCYGTRACDLAAPDFTCRAEVDAAGGPKSATAELYRSSNARAPRQGCDVPCAKVE